MKKKELKSLAQKIAKLEQRNSQEGISKQEQAKIQQELMELCGKVTNFDEITIIDEMVQEILQKS